MINNMSEIHVPVSMDALYMEPRFSFVGALSLDSLTISTQTGQGLYPYILTPQTMPELHHAVEDPLVPVVLTSAIEVDIFSSSFNMRQNPELAHRYIIQFGLGEEELSYAKRMLGHKFKWFLLHAPHGAQQAMVEQVIAFRMLSPEATLIVGDFYNRESIDSFVLELNKIGAYRVDFWQIAVDKYPDGVRNLGLPTLAQIRQAGYPVIASVYQMSAKALFFSLASGAKWVHCRHTPTDKSLREWQDELHTELYAMLAWNGLNSLDQVYEAVTLHHGSLS
ncbi:hypothetical protein PVA45_03845 [Entomospira entomophila]|uniref:Uncharacterized protein n=1 Tax=Entomospira entomophila TaxID=2719988 RepID=A0A968GBM4_9SPIO|nr:hypothetical protein [Entomospira entomophilus]NIZ40643.1 hypothetical protein [Entomospira entomophilus]WDI34857.1 hypothetical protein PVA45_03845 [Entomospira entomophilus]